MPRSVSIFFLLLVPVCALGGGVGSVQGRVSVEGGALVPVGVKVSVPGQSTDVAPDGTYSLYNLFPKKYDIAVDWPEVGTQIKTDVEVVAQDPVMLDFVFQPPKPVIGNIHPPTLIKAQPLVITGRHFLHAANAALEVRINDKVVPATRKSDTEIEVATPVISSLINSLGIKQTVHELPVLVKINGLASQEAKVAVQSVLVGNIAGEIVLSNPRLPVTGARLKIPQRQMDIPVPDNRRFDLAKIPPRPYHLVLDWPALGLTEQRDFEVLPGQTAVVKFKVDVPAPFVKAVVPPKIDKAEAIVLKGNFFMHSLKAPMEVTIGDLTVKAQRISNQVIQIPKEGIERVLEKYVGRLDLTGKITVAGAESEPFPIPVPGPHRETAAESEKAPEAKKVDDAKSAEPEKADAAKERTPDAATPATAEPKKDEASAAAEAKPEEKKAEPEKKP